MEKHIINCSATPHIPKGWKIEEEDQLPGRVRGKFVWDPAKVVWYLSQNQQNGNNVLGYELEELLVNDPVLPANVLDFLLKNPNLIPEGWKRDVNDFNHPIYFWGTLYRDSRGYQYVRYLHFSSGWRDGNGWLGGVFSKREPAALRASR